MCCFTKHIFENKHKDEIKGNSRPLWAFEGKINWQDRRNAIGRFPPSNCLVCRGKGGGAVRRSCQLSIIIVEWMIFLGWFSLCVPNPRVGLMEGFTRPFSCRVECFFGKRNKFGFIIMEHVRRCLWLVSVPRGCPFIVIHFDFFFVHFAGLWKWQSWRQIIRRACAPKWPAPVRRRRVEESRAKFWPSAFKCWTTASRCSRFR